MQATDASDFARRGRGRALVRRACTLPFLAAIRVYQVTLSPIMGGQCRFQPTCSRYAAEAYERHGPVRGTWLTVRRILRCQPFGGWGYDPVPPERAEGAQESSRKQEG